jgi:5-formyltetrahydrofolate cyclo-ligase
VKTSYDKDVTNSVSLQPLPTASKQDWRRWAKQRRAQLAQPSLDDEVIKVLRSSELYQRASHILSYLAFGSEINLANLYFDSSKTFYVTRIWDDNTLTLHPLDQDLEPHRYGFLQPPSTAPVIDLNFIDLVLVPGLCFDRHGTRLGYGQGHYDRLLPRFAKGVARIGVTSEQLLVEKLPRESFDSSMTHLVTETELYTLPPT